MTSPKDRGQMWMSPRCCPRPHVLECKKFFGTAVGPGPLPAPVEYYHWQCQSGQLPLQRLHAGSVKLTAGFSHC